MSEPNKNLLSEENKNSDLINVDESVKVEIKDDEVAEISDKLNPEELESIVGGSDPSPSLGLIFTFL